jgi:hypothetical protein
MNTVVREIVDAGAREVGGGVQAHGWAKVVLGAPVARARQSPTIVDCLFAPRRLVAYRLRLNSRERLFVFRTLEAPDDLSTQVPGVSSRVRLLLCAQTARRIQRALRILRIASGRTPEGNVDDLSDSFFLRAANTLSRRAPISSIVNTLLEQESSSWTS